MWHEVALAVRKGFTILPGNGQRSIHSNKIFELNMTDIALLFRSSVNILQGVCMSVLVSGANAYNQITVVIFKR